MEECSNEAQGSISVIQANETTKESEDAPNKYEDEPLNEIYLILKKDFLNSLIGYKNDVHLKRKKLISVAFQFLKLWMKTWLLLIFTIIF